MSAKTEQRYFTRTELAVRLRVRPQTLAGWHCMHPPRGPRAVKVGGLLTRYDVQDVLEWERDPAAYEARQRKADRKK